MKELNPIFKEAIQFFNDKNVKIEQLKEGYYWFDRQIIKAFDKEGNIHKIARIFTDDELELTCKLYEVPKDLEIESWNETALRYKEHLLQLEKESLDVIQDKKQKYSDYEPIILTSGGKDSVVTSHLVKKVTDNPLSIYNNTSLDHASTYKFIKKQENTLTTSPKEGFYQWQKRTGMIGNRTSRSCCTNFKKFNLINNFDGNRKSLFFMGMRNDESNTRANYGYEWKNTFWGERPWQAILPIRKWTDLDIWLYIFMNDIEFNEVYRLGYSRCSCAVACSFATKSSWVLDKYWKPHLYERWHKILEKDFVENKKAPTMNCTLKEWHMNWNGGRVRTEATPEIIQEFAKQQGLTYELAEKYFNKTCSCCNKKLKKNDIGLNLKFISRRLEEFQCTKCLAVTLGYTNKQMKDKAKELKTQGCELF